MLLDSKCATPQHPCALGELGSWGVAHSEGLLPFTQRVLHKINQPSILAARIDTMLNHIEGKVIGPAKTPHTAVTSSTTVILSLCRVTKMSEAIRPTSNIRPPLMYRSLGLRMAPSMVRPH